VEKISLKRSLAGEIVMILTTENGDNVVMNDIPSLEARFVHFHNSKCEVAKEWEGTWHEMFSRFDVFLLLKLHSPIQVNRIVIGLEKDEKLFYATMNYTIEGKKNENATMIPSSAIALNYAQEHPTKEIYLTKGTIEAASRRNLVIIKSPRNAEELLDLIKQYRNQRKDDEGDETDYVV